VESNTRPKGCGFFVNKKNMVEQIVPSELVIIEQKLKYESSYNEFDYLCVFLPFLCVCTKNSHKKQSAYKPNNQLLFIVSRVLPQNK